MRAVLTGTERDVQPERLFGRLPLRRQEPLGPSPADRKRDRPRQGGAAWKRCTLPTTPLLNAPLAHKLKCDQAAAYRSRDAGLSQERGIGGRVGRRARPYRR